MRYIYSICRVTTFYDRGGTKMRNPLTTTCMANLFVRSKAS